MCESNGPFSVFDENLVQKPILGKTSTIIFDPTNCLQDQTLGPQKDLQ